MKRAALPFSLTRTVYGLAASACALMGARSSAEVTSVSVVSPCAAATELQPANLSDLIAVALDGQPQLLIAKEAVEKAHANLLAARTPFLPSVALSLQSERYVPSTITSPTVIGNTVVGGTRESKTTYGSVSLNWNLYSGGRDTAALNAYKSDLTASQEGVYHQLDETLTAILNAYADVYKAQQSAVVQARILTIQQDMEQRSKQQFQQGTTTTLAIAQATTAVLQTSQQLFETCRGVADKSAVLAQTVGLHLGPDELYRVDELRDPLDASAAATEWRNVIDDDPAVVAAKANVNVAEYKLKETKASYGPTLGLEGRKDYLGQDADSWRSANHITPSGYRIGLQIQQPLLPMTSEYSAVQAAKSDLRKAQATYQQAILDTEAKYHSAFNAVHEAAASLSAAKLSLEQSQALLSLTQAQLSSGRADQDKVQQAQIAVEKATDAVTQATTALTAARWLSLRANEPRTFPARLVKQFNVDSSSL